MFSQIEKDTSYTVISTYTKEIKKYPFIKPVQLPENKALKSKFDVVYKQLDYRQLHLDAYYTKKGPAQPAVILIHGGGWKSGDKSHMHYMAQQIAAEGYSCFCVEYRLSPEAKYPAGVVDVKEAIKYVKAHASKFNANPEKVAVLGCSSGGQMAALIGTTPNNPDFEEATKLKENTNVQAIIDMDGVIAFHHPLSTEGKVAAFWLGGTYEEVPEVWEDASALSHTDKNTPPTLFINSDNPRFHAGREEMIAILDKYNTYYDVKTILNSPHSFWFFEPWFDEITDYSITFLDKVFKQK